MDIAEGVPDSPSDAALGPARRHLELSLEQVERVNPEHGSERVVLQCKDAAHTQMNGEVGWWDSCYV